MDVGELLKSIDIVEFIGQYVELTQNGEEFWGLSPFKDEKTPSFSVRRETNQFYDFSSGFGGSLIAFLQRYKHISASEAIQELADYAGVNGYEVSRKSDLSATSVCKRFLSHKSSEKCVSHTHLSDDYMCKYEKRDEKLAEWESEGISRVSLDKFQVYYDGFSDRLVYPIRDLSGKIVNVGGRTLDPQWKEKKLRKYTYFFGWGGGMDVVYGLSENMAAIKQRQEVIIFEGVKSVFLADSWGICNSAALLTSHLSPEQMKVLARLGCRVVFALDKDVTIRDDKNIRALKQFVSVEYIYDTQGLLEAKDSPVDKGREVFERLYAQRFRWR